MSHFLEGCLSNENCSHLMCFEISGFLCLSLNIAFYNSCDSIIELLLVQGIIYVALVSNHKSKILLANRSTFCRWIKARHLLMS